MEEDEKFEYIPITEHKYQEYLDKKECMRDIHKKIKESKKYNYIDYNDEFNNNYNDMLLFGIVPSKETYFAQTNELEELWGM